MGQIQKPSAVKLIISIFTRNIEYFKSLELTLSRKFGAIDYSSPIFNFNHTLYYQDEFGKDLKRKLISFQKLIDREDLYKIKIFTNEIEDNSAKQNKRQFNIDPGYITQSNLILASTKDFSHRIYIKDGIHQEVTMIFKDKTFRALPWTYPDYQAQECIDIFIKIRDILNSQLKNNARLS